MRTCCSILTALIAFSATAIALADNHAESARSGETVFGTHCTNCHTGGFGGFFSGAPDVEDSDDVDAMAAKGLDALTENTINGIGDMVARGGCTECTDEEIRSAVAYMLASPE